MSIASSSGNDSWKSQIAQLTLVEKQILMEELWADLARSPSTSQSPGWHGDVVKGRLQLLDEGKAAVEDWEDVERQLDELE